MTDGSMELRSQIPIKHGTTSIKLSSMICGVTSLSLLKLPYRLPSTIAVGSCHNRETRALRSLKDLLKKSDICLGQSATLRSSPSDWPPC